MLKYINGVIVKRVLSDKVILLKKKQFSKKKLIFQYIHIDVTFNDGVY